MEKITTVGLADQVKAACGLASSYALAKVLDIKPQTVRAWYNIGTIMDDATGMACADLLGLPPESVVLWLQVERMHKRGNDNLSHLWEGIAQRLAA